MIPNYSMIPAIRWSPVIRWSIGSMDFDNPKVYGDTSISDGLVLNFELPTCKSNILSKMASSLSELFSQPNYLTYLITHINKQGCRNGNFYFTNTSLCTGFGACNCLFMSRCSFWHLWNWVTAVNWIGQKGSLQFIGSLGHYFTPGGWVIPRRL